MSKFTALIVFAVGIWASVLSYAQSGPSGGPSGPGPFPSTIVALPPTSATVAATGTIAITNTFQAVLAANTSRKACMIQNQGTHTMFVCLNNTIGSCTTANSIQIGPGVPFYCAGPSVIASDAVNITGTSGDAFVVDSQ